ncbi:MAG: alkaline phosphatase D family protein [Planctomycetaceae bacterium]
MSLGQVRRCVTTLAFMMAAFCATATAQVTPEPLSRIAFGSCAKQDQPQPIWDSVIATQPEIFLFIGDNIYGDSEDMNVLKQKWAQLGAQPGYQHLKQQCPVYAVWDDHDYGLNDGGREYRMKRESQQVFLDFFEEAADSPRRTREGLYGSRTYGPPDKQVQIILLDTRYFRSPLTKRTTVYELGEGDRGPYAAMSGPDAVMLGETQWTWLEAELRKPAQLRIIASSIQFLSDGHRWEGWGLFPAERQRLLDLIKQTKANGVTFISGDRHSAEISGQDSGLGYQIIDVTSSSLNSPGKWHTETNLHRLSTKYVHENFGTILIDWTESDPTVRAQVRDINGEVVMQHRARLSELQVR